MTQIFRAGDLNFHFFSLLGFHDVEIHILRFLFSVSKLKTNLKFLFLFKIGPFGLSSITDSDLVFR